jgi:dUTP pyrophosphatase
VAAFSVKVKKLNPAAKLPAYAHPAEEGELGADLYALGADRLEAGQIKMVCTGIALELPAGYGALVEDRSGLATRGVCTLGGVIDSGYRGEIKVIMANFGAQPYEMAAGDRIAQLRLTQCLPAVFCEVEELAASTRGEGGFGSTGR